MMDWSIAIYIALSVAALMVLSRKGVVDFQGDRVRKGSGHALLGLQQFIEPSVEHILEADYLQDKDDENDNEAGEDDLEALQADLAAALGNSPIDPDEIRRHLAKAARLGLDWREFYEEAVRVELKNRPYRSPAMPPIWRVAPRLEGDATI